jgi:hypothetical protein
LEPSFLNSDELSGCQLAAAVRPDVLTKYDVSDKFVKLGPVNRSRTPAAKSPVERNH